MAEAEPSSRLDPQAGSVTHTLHALNSVDARLTKLTRLLTLSDHRHIGLPQAS